VDGALVGAGPLWLVHDDDDNHQSALPFALQQQLDLLQSACLLQWYLIKRPGYLYCNC